VKKITATDAKNRLGAVLDDAQREPVVIQRQERDVAVILSMAEFERMRAGNVRAFLDARNELAEEAKANGLTDEILQRLLKDDD
jgi:prevent-host-death family protein